MISWVTSDDPYNWVWYFIWRGILGILVTKGYTILGCIWLDLGAYIRMKEITSEQVSQYDFGTLFVSFWIPKRIVMDADRIFRDDQENFPVELTHYVTYILKGKPQGN